MIQAGGSDHDAETLVSDAQHLTSPGTMLGTVAYMSPEQIRAQELDARTDLFSFGGVLYEMASGRIPFDGSSSGEICGAILHQEPSSQVSQQISPALHSVIRKALEKDRSLRYQSAADMRADLQRLKAGYRDGAACNKFGSCGEGRSRPFRTSLKTSKDRLSRSRLRSPSRSLQAPCITARTAQNPSPTKTPSSSPISPMPPAMLFSMAPYGKGWRRNWSSRHFSAWFRTNASHKR